MRLMDTWTHHGRPMKIKQTKSRNGSSSIKSCDVAKFGRFILDGMGAT